MPNIGPLELLLILFLALILLGPSRLPDLANALGKSIREFRKAAAEDDTASTSSPPRPEASPAEPTPSGGPERASRQAATGEAVTPEPVTATGPSDGPSGSDR